MSAKVIPIRKCSRCGIRFGKVKTFAYRENTKEEVLIPFISCDQCLRLVTEELAYQRGIFNALLKMGVSHGAANAMMIAKSDYESENSEKA